MAAESMTREERVACAMAMEKPDRVPVVPQIVISSCLNFCGVSPGKGYNDINLAHECMLKTFDDFGGWDALFETVPDVADTQLLSSNR
ncbi:MAG: hypothetical protein JRC92_09865 [Deltaproteobacteria bacterium]|nr:hypothetical protein [Deltaproteobacteria bacterium]